MRLYLETTMFNYYFDTDREGHADVVSLFEEIRAGKHEAYTSGYAALELSAAPEPKRSNMLALIEEYGITVHEITGESNRLAKVYLSEGIIPEKFQEDAAHIAIASIHGLDCILSYNFRHINRLRTKVRIEPVNHREGYSGIVICTAREVLEDEQQADE